MIGRAALAASGDGCFFVNVVKGRNKCGIGVLRSLGFQITQHIRDKELLNSFIAYFKCGSYTVSSN